MTADEDDRALATVIIDDLLDFLDDWIRGAGYNPLICDTDPYDEAKRLQRSAATFRTSHL